MSDIPLKGGFAARLLYGLAFVLVVVGLVNAMPSIPGFEPAVRDLIGNDSFKIRRFTPEYFYPLAFVTMMLIVALKHSIWRTWAGRSPLRSKLGLFLDIALVVAAMAIALTYTVELQSICLIDQFTGERARLIAEAMEAERETAELFGLPEPTTVDDPNCVANTGGWLVAIVGVSTVIFLAYNIKVWGLPLVLVAILVVSYTFFTVGMWYFFGAEELNKYLVTKLGGEPRMLIDGRPRVHDILTNTSSGYLGRFMSIILNTIFPYLILGSLFGVSAGGQSLIKLAFRWTRNLRGGPAHAAIVSSAMFGTISGGPVVNVLSTGVLTIPMMIKRGFSKVFAGGMEAAASSGGSIMPPVMGVAAFILAALTGVPYSLVIIAAVIPAIAYFGCLFLSVVFQSRKQGIEAIGELTEDMMLDRQDRLNLTMIFAPIFLILVLLLTKKQDVGCGLLGGIFGADRTFTDGNCSINSLSWFLQLVQNSAGDAGSAGWWAVMLLMGLLFLDPEMRAKPRKLIDALSNAGVMISTLYLMFLAVTIIDFCLQFTGLPSFISLDVLEWLRGFDLGSGGSILFQFLALAATMGLAILLGMGMPAVPAYINVTLLMGPVLAGLGISIFTANMFIFYFAVASAITPPVALAAFAAASITKQDPMRTGLSAVRSGIVMFVIPFVFAMYPELLLIEQAQIDPNSIGGQITYLPGYDGSIDMLGLGVLLLRLMLALYLLASALARYDAQALASWNWPLRLALCVLILFSNPLIFLPAAAAGIGLILLSRMQTRGVALG
ncbi:TRAP transporter large permease subunit [Phaeobacter marinintestinus]|uniref:TRAP transporter large permease subunit n=1 Tax=Falsiphaeobacter marinintestinus TaxID=1492905 RepID=UPI001FE87503|nr:TRAP transporter large permease subunit [Phaeobacter marinintestinus]